VLDYVLPILIAEPQVAIALAKRFLDTGAYIIMIESEGITEHVQTWRIDVIAEIGDALSLDRVVFEAADPDVFAWYLKNYGPDVNLFVDHSQIVQLENACDPACGEQRAFGGAS
jgi:phosphosulfolactate synthase (CoM biosynthesis protein A)